MNKIIILSMVGSLLVLSSLAQTNSGFKGQGPIKPVNTQSRAINPQWRGTLVEERNGLFFNNEFNGGRLNGVHLEDDGTISVIISPENQPINSSPWYAFKIWADTSKQVSIKLTYPPGVRHRYHPKISNDGSHWRDAEKKSMEQQGSHHVFDVDVSRDTLWVAAQPLVTSDHVYGWLDTLSASTKASTTIAGTSTLGKPISVLHIGDTSSQRKIVVLGRQHPPEITGHLALQYFVETLLGNDPDIERLREGFHIYVLPLLNPDGVDGGFWRHNQGGVDLNRDWADFNQQETRVVRDYLANQLVDGSKLYFAIDFHSTHDDIFYTVDPKREGNLPGLVNQWLKAVADSLPDYKPNVKPLYFGPPTSTAFGYLFETYEAEALVYEIGDGTPDEFIRRKSEVAAESLAKLLLKRVWR